MTIPTVFGTQMHWLTLTFIVIEIPLFAVQLFHFLNRPSDRKRLWYLLLLALLIKYNICSGLLPDPSWGLDMRLQNILAYVFAYLMGAYLPFYFYKAYDLRGLRFHATWGVSLFVLLPYVIFTVVYVVNNDFLHDQEWLVLFSATYGLVVIAAMLRAIFLKYRETGSVRRFRCQIAVWLAILPWEAMAVFAFVPPVQWLRTLMANVGWLVITIVQFRAAIRFSWYEHRKLKGLQLEISKDDFLAYCKAQGMTERIADVAWLWAQGHSKQAIADQFFISKDTVKSHIGKLYKVLEVGSLEDLIRKVNLEGGKRP